MTNSNNVFVVALIFFLDVFFDYSMYWYNLLMYMIPYSQACGGISYLSNLTLIIIIDLGKRKWLYSDNKLRRIRRGVHITVGFLVFAIMIEFFVTYIKTEKK